MGVGDGDFEYPLELVKRGWRIMQATGRVPLFDEVALQDPRWESDILYMDDWWRWVNKK